MKTRNFSRARGPRATASVSRRKSAFTLIELIIVIGLMGLLATIATAGYTAATRGMADRGAQQDAVSLLRLAQQRCWIDNVPTAVFFCNRALHDDDGISFAGVAVAVQMGGRITSKKDSVLVDEFADWDKSYPKKGSDNAPSFRLYRMASLANGGGLDSFSSVLKPFVKHIRLDELMLADLDRASRERGQQKSSLAGDSMANEAWCDERAIGVSGSSTRIGSGSNLPDANANCWRWGFEISSGLPAGTWKIGDAYGTEIARIQLPKGYIFGTESLDSQSETHKTDDLFAAKGVQPAVFTTDITQDEQARFSMNGSVRISAMRLRDGLLGVTKLADISASDLRDDATK